MTFTRADRRFLKSLKVAVDEPKPTQRVSVDETVRLLRSNGIPVTPENWMRLQFAGNPPEIGEVDGEILSELPAWVREEYDLDFDENEEEEDQ